MKTATTTLFEHETTRGFNCTPRDVEALAILNQRLGVEVLKPVFVRGVAELKAQNHVGLIRLGRRSIQILPKMYRSTSASKDEARMQATRNLLHMLAYASDVRIREGILAPLLRRGADWFELLTYLFCTHLAEEWRRGPVRSYQPRDETLSVLKGRWRISDSLRKPERRHLFDVTFDEFTEDIPLNRIFRYVTEYLWRSTRNAQNKSKLDLLRQWMDAGSIQAPGHAPIDEARRIRLSRLESRFQPTLNLARLFLANESLELQSGDTTMFAFVFDMNRLFEAFISQFIQAHRRQILPAALQASRVVPQAFGHRLSFALHQGSAQFTLSPDILFVDGQSHPLIVDTKYKQLAAGSVRAQVAEADMYQMFAYAHRYDCARVLLLYPQTAEAATPVRRFYQVQRSPVVVEVATVDVRRDFAQREEKVALMDELRAILEAGAA